MDFLKDQVKLFLAVAPRKCDPRMIYLTKTDAYLRLSKGEKKTWLLHTGDLKNYDIMIPKGVV